MACSCMDRPSWVNPPHERRGKESHEKPKGCLNCSSQTKDHLSARATRYLTEVRLCSLLDAYEREIPSIPVQILYTADIAESVVN